MVVRNIVELYTKTISSIDNASAPPLHADPSDYDLKASAPPLDEGVKKVIDYKSHKDFKKYSESKEKNVSHDFTSVKDHKDSRNKPDYIIHNNPQSTTTTNYPSMPNQQHNPIILNTSRVDDVSNDNHQHYYQQSHNANRVNLYACPINCKVEICKPLYNPFTIQVQSVKYYFNKWAASLYFAPKDFVNRNKQIVVRDVLVPYWISSLKVHSIFNVLKNGRRSQVSKPESSYRVPMLAMNTLDEYYEILSNINVDTTFYHEKGITQVFNALFGADDEKDTLYSDRFASPPNNLLVPATPYADVWTASGENHVKNLEIKSFTLPRIAEKEKLTLDKLYVTSKKLRLIYLPFYLCSYTYDSKQYFFVVDGVTGAVKGSRPKSALGRLTLGKYS